MFWIADLKANQFLEINRNRGSLREKKKISKFVIQKLAEN